MFQYMGTHIHPDTHTQRHTPTYMTLTITIAYSNCQTCMGFIQRMILKYHFSKAFTPSLYNKGPRPTPSYSHSHLVMDAVSSIIHIASDARKHTAGEQTYNFLHG